MLSIDSLEPIEDLIRLDPIRSYPDRATKALADIVGAGRHAFHNDATPNADTYESSEIVLSLRNHLQSFGAIELGSPRSGNAFTQHDLRVARWGTRIIARQLAMADRIRNGEDKTRSRSDIEKSIARLPLTPREREVVGLIVVGTSTRGVAEKTNLTVATVHTYLKRIYPKVGVRSRVELVALVTGTISMA